jgi:predicted outer membrane protein
MKNPRRSLSFPRVVGAAAAAGLLALSAAGQAFPPPIVPPSNPPAIPEPITPPPDNITNDVTTQPNGLPGRSTEQVITKISQLTSEQLRISQIAAARAASTQIRTFAEQVQATTQDLQQEIDRMAQSKSILPPTGRSSAEAAAEEREWQGKDARDLDNDYVDRVLKIQRDAIDTLEDYADDKDMDPEVVTFANKHLPAMREQLRQAESLKQRMD